MGEKDKKWTPEQVEFLKNNYEHHTVSGLSRLMGMSSKRIKNKANRLNLVKRHLPSKTEYMPLYEKGMTDYEIAVFCTVRVSSVRIWRIKNKLPSNAKKGISKKAGTVCQREKKNDEDRSVFSHLKTFSEEVTEFLKAIDAFRNKNRRRPTLIEGFQIAKSLGWEKQKQ